MNSTLSHPFSRALALVIGLFMQGAVAMAAMVEPLPDADATVASLENGNGGGHGELPAAMLQNQGDASAEAGPAGQSAPIDTAGPPLSKRQIGIAMLVFSFLFLSACWIKGNVHKKGFGQAAGGHRRPGM